MYSFLIESVIKPETDYQFFTFRGKKPVTVNFRGHEIQVSKGMKFGVRPSANKKHIRMIFPDEPNRVITLDLKTAQDLANSVGKD